MLFLTKIISTLIDEHSVNIVILLTNIIFILRCIIVMVIKRGCLHSSLSNREHNSRIEYGDMQLISEAYDVLKSIGKLSNEELRDVFSEWNKGEFQSFLIEITVDIFGIKDDK